jgi:hypothetical protein
MPDEQKTIPSAESLDSRFRLHAKKQVKCKYPKVIQRDPILYVRMQAKVLIILLQTEEPDGRREGRRKKLSAPKDRPD